MPDPKLPAELDQVIGEIPAMARGLPELRAQILGLPPLSPNSLPGLRPAFLPDQQGADAVSPDPSGGTASAITGDPPGTTSGTSITPGTLPDIAFATGIDPVLVVSALPAASSYPNRVALLTVDYKLYRSDGVTWTKATDGADIIANSIIAGKLAAGVVGATELAATIVLASLIKTAASGTRVEMDQNGIRAYNGSTLIVNIPTDGSPVYIDAQVQASALNVLGNATLHGTANEVTQGGVLTLDASVSNPTAAPVLVQGWDSFPVTDAVVEGLCYDAAGGAGGATKVFWSLDGGLPVTLREIKCSDGTTGRSSTLTDWTGFVHSVARFGAYLYVQGADLGPVYKVRRYLASTLALDTTYGAVSYPCTNTTGPQIASDGTDIYIVDVENIGRAIKWNKYNSAMVKQGATIATGFSPGGSYVVRSVAVGTFDFGVFRVMVAGNDGIVHSFDSTGAHQTNECFPVPNAGVIGVTYGDAAGDGARFWSAYPSAAITKHTTWTWTTASSTYWVAYSWYDSNATGGTHETTVGPRASITMGKRKYLNVYNATIPAGGTDDPNDRRIYMLPNATDPGVGGLKLQETANGTSTTLYTYNAAGAADPASNNFPAGSPAEIKSATAGWSLKGDGSATFGTMKGGGSSFPSSPTTNDRYYRTDLRTWFVFSGSVWLAIEETALPLYPVKFADSVAGVFLRGHAKGPMTYMAANDFFIKALRFVTLPQTTNNGTAFWTVTAYKATAAGGTTSLGSFTTAADTVNQWTEHEIAVGALVGSTNVELQIDCQKTGAPGALLILGTGYGFVTI